MNTKKTIRKILFTVVALLVGAGMLTLLIAAIGEKKKGECKDYKIIVKSLHDNFFLDDKDVFRLLSSAVGGNLKGQPISAINTRKLEDMLENNVWVKDAQLYFDNNNVLHISVTEREPLARLFTTGGNSFYIDSNEKRMSLSEKMSARVPVFTGFPDKKRLSQTDSALLKDVKAVAQFISSHPFWLSQASEIDITPERNFEMVPLVGNHLIKIGDAENLDRKFHRLFVFYQSVLSKTGFDKYKIIDAQYEGQIVAVRKVEKINAADTARLKMNVQKLLKQALEEQNDTLVTAKPVSAKTSTLNTTEHPLVKADQDDNSKASDPNPLKLSIKSDLPEKPIVDQKKATLLKKPKAVMKKTN
jgi:cell division protein FtsQ